MKISFAEFAKPSRGDLPEIAFLGGRMLAVVAAVFARSKFIKADRQFSLANDFLKL